jgi:hypothetical protein
MIGPMGAGEGLQTLSGALVLLAIVGIPTPNLSLSQESTAVEIEFGRQYEGGTRVSTATHGVSFIVPPEWTGGLPQGSQPFLLGSNTKPGIGIVVMIQAVTPEELVERLNEPQVLDEGFVLHPAGPINRSGQRLAASYQAGENVGRAVAVLGPRQNAIVHSFVGPRDFAAYYETLLERMAASTQFSSINPAVGRTSSWRALLAGMMLKRMQQYSSGIGGGYNMSTVWHLCRDGRFTYEHTSHVTVQIPDSGLSAADQDRRQGTWQVEIKGTDAVLILTGDDGAVTSHALAHDGEKTFLDGERVFRLNSEECR